MIDEHRKVMGSHQISIRAADLLEDMRPHHYNGMNRAQTVRTINDILQGRTERTVDAFLIVLLAAALGVGLGQKLLLCQKRLYLPADFLHPLSVVLAACIPQAN